MSFMLKFNYMSGRKLIYQIYPTAIGTLSDIADRIPMIAKLQEDFGLPFPQSDGKSLSTVKELYDYIRNSENNAD